MESLKSNYRRAVFIWIGMVFSIFLYAFVVELMRMNPAFLKRLSIFPETEIFRYGFLFLPIAVFFLIGLIRKQILSNKPRRNPASHGVPFPSKIPKLLSASIVTNALCESVAIFGLGLFFLTKNIYDFYLLLVLSLIYFVFYFPRYAQWEESIREGEEEGSLGIFVRS